MSNAARSTKAPYRRTGVGARLRGQLRAKGTRAPSRASLALVSFLALAATLLLGAAGASAADPTLTVDPVSSHAITTAHATGTITTDSEANGGAETFYFFEYTEAGKEEWNFGPQAFTRTVPAETTAQAVEEDLSGLNAETAYEVRLAAYPVIGGEFFSSPSPSFTTDPAPNAPVVKLQVPTPSYLTAHIQGTVDPEGGNLNAPGQPVSIHWVIELSETGEPGTFFPAAEGDITGPEAEESNPISVSADPGLPHNTTFHYRLRAAYAGLQSLTSDATFKTLFVAKPELTIENASEVSYLSAKAKGSVELANSDPAFNASCEFQYATEADFSNAAAVPCEPSTVEGAGAHSVTANITGLAPSTTYHLRIVAANAGGSASEEAPATFETLFVDPPSVTIADPTAITGHGAQVSGEVDPEGADPAFDSSCEFQYATEADFSDAVGVPCEPATVEGAGPQAVKATLAGLRAKTTYHLRLLATNAGGTSEVVAAAPFVTAGVAPTIESTSVAGITQASAELQAQINPEGELTTYRFEYIADGPNYAEHGFANATRLPASPGEDPSLGAAYEPKTAGLLLEGLSPDTLYHYRVRATNSFGTATGPGQIFRTYAGPAGGLPDGRVYEQVSPSNKHGNDAGTYIYNAAGFAAPDGNSIMYLSVNSALAENASNGWIQQFTVANRTSNGWINRSTNPRGAPGPAENPEQNNTGGFFGAVVNQFAPSADLSHFAYSTYGHKAALGPPDETGLESNFYLAGPDPMVEPDWPSRSNPTGAGRVSFLGGSPDFSTIYFFSSGLLGPSASGFYEYRNGVLSDAGELPPGMTSTAAAGPAVGIGLGSSPAQSTEANVVSADGSRAFFTREDEAGKIQLYAHLISSDGSQRSLLISRSQLSGQVGQPAPSGILGSQTTQWYHGHFENHAGEYPDYVHASSDGVHAIFLSADRLTEDAPAGAAPKAYDFNLDSGELQYLPGVSGSIVATAADGSAFLFENTSSSPFDLEYWAAGPNGGTVRPIAELPGDAPACGIACVGPARVSDDGSSAVFSTESPIPGFNDGGGVKQVFRYEATAAELSCISCPPAGVAPFGDAIMSHVVEMANSRSEPEAEVKATVVDSQAVSSDGTRVFFDTPAKLVSTDTNGDAGCPRVTAGAAISRYACMDVYEWEADGVGTCHRSSGCLFLLSSGTSTLPSFFLSSSPSGGDVFITTADGLVSSDKDGSFDVYDVRVARPGDSPPPPPVPCQGEACREAPSSPGALPGAGSAFFDGPGNQKPKQKKQKKHHHKKHSGKKSNRHGGQK